MKIYNAIKYVLEIIENNLNNKLCIDYLAKEAGVSKVHLQRVFMMTFNMPLAKYIRLRKLSESLKKLTLSDYRVIDIANELGFEHEQSYIRAFKREFGITPGQFKSKGSIIKTTPAFTMNSFINTSNGILTVPDVVVMPEIYLIGDLNYISWEESLEKAPRVAKEFWQNNKSKIKNIINKDIYIGLTRVFFDECTTSYLSSVQVPSIKSTPEGFHADRLPASEYLRFSYIGKHHYYDLNRAVMCEMYKAIDDYIKNNQKYNADRSVYLERVDTSKYDGVYCCLEWLTPVALK